MKKIALIAALVALSACDSPEPAEPQPTATPVAVETKPSLPAPREEAFAAAYAEGCPQARSVSTSLCKSKGLGKTGFVCEYGLGNDEHRRHSAELVPGEGKWTLADPENTCIAA